MPAIQRGLVSRPRTTRAISSAMRRALGAVRLAGVEVIKLRRRCRASPRPPRSRRRSRRRRRRRAGRARGHPADAPARRRSRRWRGNRRRRRAALGAAIGVRHGGEIGFAQLLARLPGAVEREVAGLRAVAAGRAAEHAREVGAGAAGRGQRIVGDRPRRGRRRGAPPGRTARSALSKMSRNRPEMRSVTSMRGRSSVASGMTSMPVTRFDCLSHTGRTPR